MAQTEQPEEDTTQFTAKSGKGLRDGVVSELITIWEVKPGHEEELRAAAERLADALLKNAPWKMNIEDRAARRAVRDLRRRQASDLVATTFETDWDPYVEDAFMSDRHRQLHRLDAAPDRGETMVCVDT